MGNNLDSFTKNILYLVENDELRNAMSKNGWQYVNKKYHYTRLIEDTRNLYDELLKNY